MPGSGTGVPPEVEPPVVEPPVVEPPVVEPPVVEPPVVEPPVVDPPVVEPPEVEPPEVEVAPPDELVVVYRNLQSHTVTLEVGMPVDQLPAALAGSELRPGLLPLNEVARAPTGVGLAAMLWARRRLLAAEAAAGRVAADWWWQQFGHEQFRPWRELPASWIHLPGTA